LKDAHGRSAKKSFQKEVGRTLVIEIKLFVRMFRTRVGVIRGGPSSEYEVSLKSGGEVLKFLPKKYKSFDILITKNGEWFLNGFLKTPSQVFDSVDVVFNALHGEFGEDGRIQQLLESYAKPYTGSGILASSFAINKHIARSLFSRHGIKVPNYLLLKKKEFSEFGLYDLVRRVFKSILPPWVIKPAATGSSIGVTIVGTFSDLTGAIKRAFDYGEVVLAEEYIKGGEATCGVLEAFRGEDFYALPVVEIIPPRDHFFDYQVKYDGSTKEICPADFDLKTKREIERAAKLAHKILGCRHYSRADFMVSARGIYLLEINTLPGLTSESLLPKAAAAVGIDFSQLLDHLLQLAIGGVYRQ
jgi:D-alanine--D-alanine ligase